MSATAEGRSAHGRGGLPAYHRPDTIARALESLLSQTFTDFAVVIVHDGHSPDVASIVDEYAREYPQIHYEENGTRLGMVGNWRRVFERARELYPGFQYFAWVSDHDLWHPRWLGELVSVPVQTVCWYPALLPPVPVVGRRSPPQ